jgi:hypothetical protein
MYEDFLEKEKIIKMPFFHCIQDPHIPGKVRNPYITPVPKFVPDYDYEYAHKLKFASLHFAPYRYKLIEELNRVKDIQINDKNSSINTGEILLPEGELMPEI